MKDRLATLLCAVGALAIFYSLFLAPPPRDEERVSRPVSTETGANGYRGLARWLESQQVPVRSLQRRFDWLTSGRTDGPERGNVLITTMPYERGVRERELDHVKAWISSGNTLVVIAGLLDTPEWSFVGRPPFVYPLEMMGSFMRLTELSYPLCAGVEEEATDEAATEAGGPIEPQWRPLDTPKRTMLTPNASHPLTEGIRSVAVISEYPADVYCAESPQQAGMLALMSDEEPTAAVWLRRLGEGTILVSGYGSILTNKILGEGDNLSFIANVLRVHLAPDGIVYFDDLHQGISSVYDAEAFFADGRLHSTFWWIVGLWFVYVLGSTRLRAAAPAARAIDESELTVAFGHLLARSVSDVQAAEHMFRHFFNDLRRGLGRPEDGRPVWEWLRTTTRLPAGHIDRLEQIHARIERGGKVDLVELHNALYTLRRELT